MSFISINVFPPSAHQSTEELWPCKIVEFNRNKFENVTCCEFLVYLGLNNLRSEVLRGPTQGPGPVSNLFGKTKVCYY